MKLAKQKKYGQRLFPREKNYKFLEKIENVQNLSFKLYSKRRPQYNNFTKHDYSCFFEEHILQPWNFVLF